MTTNPTKEQIEAAREWINAHPSMIPFDIWTTLRSCLTPPEPAASEGGLDIPNDFEAYPELLKRIEYLYKNGTGFSLMWWGEFLSEIKKSLFMASGNNNGAIWVATIRDLSAEVDCLNEKLTALQREFQRKCDLLSKAETMIYRLEADRKLAVEGLKKLHKATSKTLDMHDSEFSESDYELNSNIGETNAELYIANHTAWRTLSKLTASKGEK